VSDSCLKARVPGFFDPSPDLRSDHGKQRLINRRQQGDLGEASAIEWLTSKGATVLIPFGHSPTTTWSPGSASD
jgi:hypothetical protein